MAITAAMVKELRERTGAGMMECKKALVEAGGEMETAVEQMRISGLAKADKKSSRTAAEGVIAVEISDDGKSVAMAEVNCETDFVAKGDAFMEFAQAVCKAVLTDNPADVEALGASSPQGDQTLEQIRHELVAKLGENIQVRRFLTHQVSDGKVGVYQHGEKIGVVTEVAGGSDSLPRDIAMHIAASRPVCLSEAEVPAELLEKEKQILVAEAAESGKPEEIIEKMVQGRLRKYLAEITLLGQAYVKDPDQTVEKLLKSNDASARFFARYEVGEGIEKKQENFAEEVMAQVKGD
ncbi:translation elongation factor Ts [Chromatiales bacterium (ex Bugula neritina AB1)]|nr:translation elongation factor Ts [Chromatiales bacterium (ex Bugula neritina AB1)]